MVLDPAGDALIVASTLSVDTPKPLFWGEQRVSSALLLRVDAAVSSQLTIEVPKAVKLSNFARIALPSVMVAPGALLAITGAGLGPDGEADAQWTLAGDLSTSLAGTTVTFDGIPAPLLSVQAQKVVCIVPLALAGKTEVSIQV
jgi:hypothetical protein